MSKKLARKSTAKKPATKKPSRPTPVPFTSTGYWLMKSEPESYSITQFKTDGRTLWTGVRNYQARNFMMHSMQPGESFVFYHSNAEPAAAVGIGRITRTSVPDPSALDETSDYHDPKASEDHPIWFCAEVSFVGEFKRPVTLAEIRGEKSLAKMALLRPGQRLSIQPLSKDEFDRLVALGGGLR